MQIANLGHFIMFSIIDKMLKALYMIKKLDHSVCMNYILHMVYVAYYLVSKQESKKCTLDHFKYVFAYFGSALNVVSWPFEEKLSYQFFKEW